ncbi:MAG: RDD family protein [Pirellulales bacterium]|nr:RDD family protein [Pirellulales bacterium]
MPSNGDQIDTRIEIVTPENIAFEYRVAGPFRRLPAYLIDLGLRVVLFWLGLMVFMLITGLLGVPGVGLGAGLVWAFLLLWFYGGLFETFWNGQTPGKRMMQIRVVTVDGRPINGLQAILRNILRTVDAIGFYQVGFVSALLTERFQRLGDLACGTMVVIEEPQWLREVLRLGDPEVTDLAARLPYRFQPSLSLGRALAAYVDRRATFAWGRRLEIARYLGEPLREKLNLTAETNLDLLLCALYQRTFVAEREGETPGQSPFAAQGLEK